MLVEINWKINDIKYEDKILDELIGLFNLDDEGLGLNRDQISELILNIHSSDADLADNNDSEEDIIKNHDLTDENIISNDDLTEDNYPIGELDDNNNSIDYLAENNYSIDDLTENNYSIDNLADNNIEDYFEDKQDLNDLLGSHENDIYDLNQEIDKNDEKINALINKLKELQNNEFSNKKSQMHSKFQMEIQKIIEEAIKNNEDELLSKNQIALSALYERLKSLELDVKENNETIASNHELLDNEKSLESKKAYLDYKIQLIKDEEKFDTKYNLEYNLSPQEEFIVIKELEELSKLMIEENINSIEELSSIREKVLEYKDSPIPNEIISNEKLRDFLLDDDEYMKLEILFKVKANELIEDLNDIAILKDIEDFDDVSKRYFMSMHYKNMEIEFKKTLNFINTKKENLDILIDSYPNIVKLESGDIGPILSQRKIPNTISVEDDKKIFLSYSSIESYESCPLKYHLGYNHKFRISDNVAIIQGNINHNSLEEINKIIIAEKERYAFDNNIELEDIGDYLLSVGEEMDNERFISKKEIEEIVRKIYNDDANINREEVKIEDVLANIFDYWENYGRKFNVLGSEYRFDITKEDKFTLIGSIDLLYKTNDGIVILDYKTTKNISDEAQKKYKKQLYTYALALRDDPLYSSKTVDKLQIYAIKSKDMLDFDLNEDNLIQRERDIDYIASNLLKNYYPLKKYNPNSNDCYYCKYSFICNKN